MASIDQLRAWRIEHDKINSKIVGTISKAEGERLAELRHLLAETEFEPWGRNQTREAFESIYGPGSWE